MKPITYINNIYLEVFNHENGFQAWSVCKSGESECLVFSKPAKMFLFGLTMRLITAVDNIIPDSKKKHPLIAFDIQTVGRPSG